MDRVYSHRISGVLKQLVVDLGLEVSFVDRSDRSLLEKNREAFVDSANILGLEVVEIEDDGCVKFTVSPKKTD